MKKLLLLWLFSCSLDCFCQDVVHSIYTPPDDKPDTVRVTLIVYYDSGPAILHTKPGFVVKQYGKDDIYMDDKKKVIKAPLEVFSYKLKK